MGWIRLAISLSIINGRLRSEADPSNKAPLQRDPKCVIGFAGFWLRFQGVGTEGQLRWYSATDCERRKSLYIDPWDDIPPQVLS